MSINGDVEGLPRTEVGQMYPGTVATSLKLAPSCPVRKLRLPEHHIESRTDIGTAELDSNKV